MKSKKKKRIRTTKKQFDEFKKEFRRVQKLLGLTEWKIFFKHVNLLTKDAFSTILCDHEGMFAEIALASEIRPDEKKEFNPKAHAKHEAIHLLVARLGGEAVSRFTTIRKIDQEEEQIVRRLERVL